MGGKESWLVEKRRRREMGREQRDQFLWSKRVAVSSSATARGRLGPQDPYPLVSTIYFHLVVRHATSKANIPGHLRGRRILVEEVHVISLAPVLAMPKPHHHLASLDSSVEFGSGKTAVATKLCRRTSNNLKGTADLANILISHPKCYPYPTHSTQPSFPPRYARKEIEKGTGNWLLSLEGTKWQIFRTWKGKSNRCTKSFRWLPSPILPHVIVIVVELRSILSLLLLLLIAEMILIVSATIRGSITVHREL